MTKHYYNDNDPKAASWLRGLIKARLLPEGDVDCRSIDEIQPNELLCYTQCHFFAGIGGWPLALQLAGWPPDLPVWTGSCPCQPFSNAGRRLGTADERHLWPVFFDLISKCSPTIIFGEQVASPVALAWLDGVFDDLESKDYTCAAADLCAASTLASHIRSRLFWVAHTSGTGREGYKHNSSISLSARTPFSKLGDPFTLARHIMAGGSHTIRPFDGLPVSVARTAARGFGNAIVPQIAEQFIRAFCEVKLTHD